jgi:dTDP-4-dehydrorhamnose 3,5-epimerase
MNDRFTKRATPLAGVFVLTRHPRRDERGHLERLYCQHELEDVGDTGDRIVQINRTLTIRQGTIRGMHYQRPPHCETKVVSCLRGEVFDVAVDLRPDSPTFLHWHGELLSSANHTSLIIPHGCAHGFQTLTDDCELLYFHTAAWRADAEAAVHAMDPLIGITWPLPITDMSDRDRGHVLLAERAPSLQRRNAVA